MPISRSASAIACLIVIGFLVRPAAAVTETGWYACTAFGGSHTGKYTFRIATSPCAVYWHEIERHLKIETCKLPRIVARKPFAPASGYVLHFNLDNLVFSDHVPGWADRGRCRAISAPDQSAAD